MPTEAAPPTAAAPKKSRKPRVLVGVAVLLAVVSTYALSLLAVHLLERSEGPLPPLDLGSAGAEETIVQLRLEELKTVANRLTVNVLVYPGDSLYDKRFDVLTTDIAVRLYPRSDLGDLQFPAGKTPAQVSTTIEAHGDPGNWPFDTYKTEQLSADVLVGTGDNRRRIPARVEVTGSLDGWEVALARVHSSGDPGPASRVQGNNADVVVKLQRAKGPLIFDLFICAVLVTLPTLALLVAVPMAMGRRKFVPPFATWYAANLFAIVPLRNILPGSPPPGAWIDQAIVQWVLIALTVAMSLYILAWVRQSD
ncbi:DUF4436 domain-containing protein [Mycobacterium kubicae]|nr:DUF4436 domain-containing protein [Mycobacterium kubicae]OBF16011.1 DUF4436 domain-containing protein [Mycobacterium kubicae]